MEKAKITKALLRKIETALHDNQGREYINPIPFQPEGTRPPEQSMRARIQRIIKSELSQQADEQEFETFEEANDFDIVDSFDREHEKSEYELMDDEEPIDFRTEADDLPSAAEKETEKDPDLGIDQEEIDDSEASQEVEKPE